MSQLIPRKQDSPDSQPPSMLHFVSHCLLPPTWISGVTFSQYWCLPAPSRVPEDPLGPPLPRPRPGSLGTKEPVARGMDSVCALSQGLGVGGDIDLSLGKCRWGPGILGMCSDDQRVFSQPLLLLPILGQYCSQAQREI